MFSVKIISCKGACSFQGAERFRALDAGLSPAGAADPLALSRCNQLLGNPSDATAIEVWWGGLVAQAIGSGQVSVSGADLGIRLNSKAITPDTTINMVDGDLIEFTGSRQGQVGYLQIPGGFPYSSESLREAPTQLKTGQIFKAKSSTFTCKIALPPLEFDQAVEFYPHPKFYKTYSVWFRQFEKTPHRIEEFSRFALKLNRLEPLPQREENISTPTPWGGLQVSPDGTAFILLSERQGIGGYPILGVFDKPSIHRLLQLKLRELTTISAKM